MRILDGWKPVFITVSAIITIIAVLSLFGHDVVKPMTKDDGILQIATSVLLCCALALVFVRLLSRKQPMLKWGEAFCILSVYTMREMDFHRFFTGEHVTRLKFYMGPYPIGEKLIGGAIMLLFIAITAHFFITNAALFVRELKSKMPRAWFVVVWGFLLAGAQLLDKLHLFTGFVRPLTEETMELGAAMMIIFCVVSFFSNGGAVKRTT